MICLPALGQTLDLGFSGLADRKVVYQLKADIKSLPGHLNSRIALSEGHVWARFLPGTAPGPAEIDGLFHSLGLELQCYLDWRNSSLEEQLAFNACRLSNRPFQKSAAFNTCVTPLNICDGDQLPVLPWGPGPDLTTWPDPPRNPEYDPSGPASPWANPWLNGTNLGCLQSGEQNTIWLKISVTTPGDLEWAFFFPEEDAFFNFLYMDWAIFPMTPTICSDIAANNPLAAPIRCNWNDEPASPLGVTGMVMDSNSIPIPTETDNFELSMPVAAGDEFLLLLDNFSGGTFNGLFDFSLSPNSAGICTTVLPASHTELIGKEVQKGVSLQWLHTSSEVPAQIEMQRANEAGQFQDWRPISQTDFMARRAIEDSSPLPGRSYYRLKKTAVGGEVDFSNLVEIQWLVPDLTIAPNPASEGKIQILAGFPIHSVRVMDVSGRLAFQRKTESSARKNFMLEPGLRSGIYTVEAIGVNGEIARQKLVVH